LPKPAATTPGDLATRVNGLIAAGLKTAKRIQ
jgi:hypothetical protein